MNDIFDNQQEKASIHSWIIILAMAFLFIAWGLFIFFMVGDKGPPLWNFGVVQDIPGQSAYSTHQPLSAAGGEPSPQHVSQRPLEMGNQEKGEKP